MIIFLYGSDDYRRTEQARFYISGYRGKYGTAPAMHFDMAERDALLRLTDYCASASMFDAHKLAVLHDVARTAEPAPLAKFLKSCLESKEIVILISAERKASSPFTFLNALKRAEHFALPEGAALSAFIGDEAGRRGIALEPAAVLLLEAASSGDTWWIATELDRAALLGPPAGRAGKKTLGVADFPHLDLDQKGVEGLLYEFCSFSRAARLAALEKLFRGRHDAGMVFNRLAYRDARKVPVFADYDVLVKSGKLDYEEALLALAVA